MNENIDDNEKHIKIISMKLLICEHCGETKTDFLPCSLNDIEDIYIKFAEKHKNCNKHL